MSEDVVVKVTDCILGPGSQSTIWTFEGVEVESGDAIVFVADHRPGHALFEALDNGADVFVEVPSWHILSRYPG